MKGKLSAPWFMLSPLTYLLAQPNLADAPFRRRLIKIAIALTKRLKLKGIATCHSLTGTCRST
jgi:hypothetical protein